jgi:hypothetical protein
MRLPPACFRIIAAFALLGSLPGCGDAWTHASVSSWKKVRVEPLVPLVEKWPVVRVDEAGRGQRVEEGAIVEVDLEIVEASQGDPKQVGMKRTAWLWIGWPRPSYRHVPDFGNEAARGMLVGRNVGTLLTVDATSRTFGKPNESFGSVFVYDGPDANSKKAVSVYDTVYRMRIKQSCPAQLSEGSGTYRSIGFEAHCGGDFLPQYCSASLFRSADIAVYRLTASCPDGKREYVSPVYGPTPKGGKDEAMLKAGERLRARLGA